MDLASSELTCLAMRKSSLFNLGLTPTWNTKYDLGMMLRVLCSFKGSQLDHMGSVELVCTPSANASDSTVRWDAPSTCSCRRLHASQPHSYNQYKVAYLKNNGTCRSTDHWRAVGGQGQIGGDFLQKSISQQSPQAAPSRTRAQWTPACLAVSGLDCAPNTLPRFF